MLKNNHYQRLILSLLVIATIVAVVLPVSAANDLTPNIKPIEFSASLQMKIYSSDAQKEAVKQKLVNAGYIKPGTTYTQSLPPCTNPKVASPDILIQS
jgi:hypothetical protein